MPTDLRKLAGEIVRKHVRNGEVGLTYAIHSALQQVAAQAKSCPCCGYEMKCPNDWRLEKEHRHRSGMGEKK